MKATDDGNGDLYFLDAPGGTGKPFLMLVVLVTVRARSDIALAVASSGIAFTLLDCNIDCNIAKTPQWPKFYHHRKSSTGPKSQWRQIHLTTNIISVTLSHRKTNLSTKYSLSSLLTKRIVNEAILQLQMQFKSIDSVTNADEATNYPIEFLNFLDVPSLPPHNLRLKVGSVVIMFRHINQSKLCNRTRLVVSKLMKNVIYVTILNEKFEGEEVPIPRIPMIPNDMPFEFKRLQFRSALHSP
ncbi:hypothetical protein LAZ67_1007109 [Cordylochernes scorpioides]|uniref:ATP-dependent DNA helicase n=1 Tax=Cordylochernes scorpioides TaxID=51811 RepID=A0ABY6JZF5_9ARAC|nr:hypothetical protein LAZ67_1007109 [Cordylochernes scorpioides]